MDLYSASSEYRDNLDIEKCKKEGIYYTPEPIVNLMIDDMFGEVNNTENIKILDMAAGCGHFFTGILEYFDKKGENIYENIYAVEKDRGSVEILKRYITGKYNDSGKINKNIIEDDALFSKNINLKNGGFDYIIGNPPYIGHKNIELEYSKKLRKEYNEVYVNKSDIYYCFFKKAVELLKEGGMCSFIVPRYFLEAQSAMLVRKYIEENTKIISIYDFRNCDVFSKKIGISPCIINFIKKGDKSDNSCTIETKIKIIQKKEDLESLLSGNNILDDGVLFKDETSWAIVTKKEKKIMDSIKAKKIYRLGEIIDSHQGIITGCDKAFILDKTSDIVKMMDSTVCKKWIKSKDIRKFTIDDSSKRLIYTDSVESIEDSVLIHHLMDYRKKLESRREVIRGIRDWYHLQWGRKESSFEQTKIVYPFKSKDNRFALDLENAFFSADVYFFTIKEEFKDKISYIYLLTLLNSSIYQTYMQAFLKKMGNSVYEYYPYRVLETYIFIDESYEMLEKMGKLVLNEKNTSKKEKLMKKIDEILEKSLDLTEFDKK